MPMAASVSAVSFRVSPLVTLLWATAMLLVSAESVLAAISKEVRVRVDAS